MGLRWIDKHHLRGAVRRRDGPERVSIWEFDDSGCTYIRDICFSPMHMDSCFVEVNT